MIRELAQARITFAALPIAILLFSPFSASFFSRRDGKPASQLAIKWGRAYNSNCGKFIPRAGVCDVQREIGCQGDGPLPDCLTSYRLQCLFYYAQVWSVVLRDSELFPEDIEALDEGPVVPAIRAATVDVPAWQPIRPASFDEEPDLDDKDEGLFLHHLWMA